MRIGRDDNFLSFELNPLDGGFGAFRIEAVALASGRKFTALHEHLMIESDELTVRRFDDFEALKCEQIEIRFTEGGSFRFQRDSRGYITVRYRIGGWKASVVMEGEVLVEGEFTGSFCREFGRLLRGSHK